MKVFNLRRVRMEVIMPQNFYELVWIFIVYAFLGWCTEVSYAALDTGKFVNRGFLNGPYCPIYGCGVVIVVAVLTPLQENLAILFAGSFLLTSVLEYLTGFMLEKFFHNKWWDYSDFPFNIKGYICLKFSILWGLACTFIMKVLHPMIYGVIVRIPHVLGAVTLVVLMSGFAVDLCVTVSTILKFNRHIRAIDEVAAALHRFSDEIGENIYENVTDVLESTETARARIADAKREWRREYEELTAKYERLLAEKNSGFRRLIDAFPDMVSRDRNETLQKYKTYFRSRAGKTKDTEMNSKDGQNR